jgi:hypothetical protein
MNLNKINLYFIILIFYSQFLHKIQSEKSKTKENFNFGVRFKSVQCQSDNKTISTNFCYLKALSRKVVTLNIGIKFLVTYKKPYYIQAEILYRYGTIFRQVIDLKKNEICSILEGVDINPLGKIIIDMIKTNYPDIIHKCPYSGDWGFTNFTLNVDLFNSATMIFPEGTYRIDISVLRGNDETFKVSLVFDNKSYIKESFG